MSAIPTFVVDDEPLARKRMLRLLRGDPEINVVGNFSSATEAATQARELAPQLLLLDIRMPELDGFELRAVARRSGHDPVRDFRDRLLGSLHGRVRGRRHRLPAQAVRR